MDFQALGVEERNRLITALGRNAVGGEAILMSRRDTSFVGTTGSVGTVEDLTDEEVITAIQSVPCHY
jgi:hypothetical protein